ncbi:MAG: FAD/NAD(P)-binding protein [Arenimonas sp.]|nr:FAD/NAD(P)-binding protein [Arenimonas sp.]
MNETIALIGSGPTAIYSLRKLLSSARPLEITVFEKEAVAGRGMPYHPAVNDRAMLANIASIEIPPIGETLVEWLERQPPEELDRLRVHPAHINDREFFPRVVLGEYFKAQFDGVVASGRAAGHSVTIKAGCEVSDVALQPDEIRVTVSRPDLPSEHYAFGHVVMATGHSFPDLTEVKPGYFASPWPAPLLKGIAAGRVGILGTSLSGIDAMVTVATSHGTFYHDEAGLLEYHRAAGSEGLSISLMSRKGMLPEADFYFPIPYAPLSICTDAAVDELIASGRDDLLDAVFGLFREELTAADPDYAAKIGLAGLTVETIEAAYFADRQESDPFLWAALNLAEAKQNYETHTTVAWRYAILRMHEVVARVVPHLNVRDLKRFHRHFKSLFVDDYATVPHASIERVLALRRAGVLDIVALGGDYDLDIDTPERGAIITRPEGELVFDTLVDATGQGRLGADEIPFPSLRRQGGVSKASALSEGQVRIGDQPMTEQETGGIALDGAFRLVVDQPLSNRLYCLALPFLLHQFPFVQGITSSNELGETVANAILADIAKPQAQASVSAPALDREPELLVR